MAISIVILFMLLTTLALYILGSKRSNRMLMVFALLIAGGMMVLTLCIWYAAAYTM